QASDRDELSRAGNSPPRRRIALRQRPLASATDLEDGGHAIRQKELRQPLAIMNVRVHQARHDELSVGANDPGSGGVDGLPFLRDGLDPVALNDDQHIANRSSTVAVNQSASFDDEGVERLA